MEEHPRKEEEQETEKEEFKPAIGGDPDAEEEADKEQTAPFKNLGVFSALLAHQQKLAREVGPKRAALAFFIAGVIVSLIIFVFFWGIVIGIQDAFSPWGVFGCACGVMFFGFLVSIWQEVSRPRK